MLRWSTVLVELRGLSMQRIARANLTKVDNRARNLGYAGIAALPNEAQSQNLTFAEYQLLAAQTDQEVDVGTDPLSLSVPMLGLEGEVGNLLVEQKKVFRGDGLEEGWNEFIAEELGDLLWYASTVARYLNLNLDTVVDDDLNRLVRSSPALSNDDLIEHASDYDGRFPQTEQFPRRLHISFKERTINGTPKVTMTLLGAEPNAFPDGPVSRGGDKYQGFKIGEPLGDVVDDNSHRADAYRYHDAIHLGFLAVLRWSPNVRALLHLKRKSDPLTDSAEDGARAIFAEEGLVAILAKHAAASRQFASADLVPEELLDLITAVVDDLEVGDLPYQMWRDAISQGFGVMQQLSEGRGGYVQADLDKRSLLYSKLPFA
ncbi:hypothetical protein GS966_01200 [Rhodococcus hoagii]|nr:hypothetical protein [Prescottella equi]NKZ88550.1 hypothetical protein [Prescottella equi]